MLKLFMPNEYVKSVFDIDPAKLKEQGIRGVITDLDNTLVAWDIKNATEEITGWFKKMHDHGIQVTVVSNNNEERVRVFSEPLGIPYAYSAKKPLTRAFKTVAKNMGLKKEEVVVVGDQLLTDILGGNRAGLYTILVVPIVQTDAAITRFNRRIERRIFKYMKKKGLINWEE